MPRSALFLDFDNVHNGLAAMNPRAAEVFATMPGRWLDWIEAAGRRWTGGAKRPDEKAAAAETRRLLVRKCYINPMAYGKYRPFFTRSGFSVVDCPPLTRNGKNAADIHMVLDVVDALRHETRFDEFIILSADADFTPVMLRLRAHDRRTVMLANPQAASAYRAACDVVIDLADFIDRALGVGDSISPRFGVVEPESAPVPDPDPDPDPDSAPAPASVAEPADSMVAAVAAVVEMMVDMVGTAAEPIPLAFLASKAIEATDGRARETRWFGYRAFRLFVRARVGDDLVIIDRHGGLLAHRGRHGAEIAAASAVVEPAAAD